MTIKLLLNGEFVSQQITSTTVGELRNELSIPTDAKVMVQGTVRTNDYELSEDEVVAYASNNKVGGQA